MNRLTIAILAAAISGIAHADFTVKIPLQNNNVTFYSWITTDPILGAWENTGDIYSCSNWSPSPSDITVGQSFTQTATDCKQNQIRTVQDRQIDELSGNIRNIGELYAQTQVITVSSTKEAVGSKESWVATTPTYTAWVNSGAITGCTNWSPATSTVASGQSFTQTATDCKQAQTRSRQDREQETTTKAIRDVGSPVSETQSITVTSTRTATDTKEVCQYQTSGMIQLLNNGVVQESTSHYVFYWNKVKIGASSGTSISSGGYTYKTGALMQTVRTDMLNLKYYQICRK